VKCKIDYVTHADSEGRVHWIDLEIDDQVFEMDRDDVLELQNICETAFNRMVNPEEAIPPILNRESVMKDT